MCNDNNTFYICNNFFIDKDKQIGVANEYLTVEKKNVLYNKLYLIVTYWTYPFGGGEEFMYDSMEWAYNLGMKSYWLAFTDSKNKKFDNLEIKRHTYGTILHIPGGFNVDILSKWIYIFNADIIHHQGHLREKFFLASEELRIPFMTGFHFWTGGLVLDSEKKNKLILENHRYHKIDNEFARLAEKKQCFFYCASKFVQECFEKITNIFIEDIIFAASSTKRYLLDTSTNTLVNENVQTAKYVTMINIHINKGGELFYKLLTKCHDIHFLCVQTEHGSEELDEKIKNEINKRNDDPEKCADCIYMERTQNVKLIYAKTKIMLCDTLVDETFCRVINESMMNGIPVFTTHRGNTKYLVESTTPILDPHDADQWETEIRKIYGNNEEYCKMSMSMREQYKKSSEDIAKLQFETTIKRLLNKVRT